MGMLSTSRSGSLSTVIAVACVVMATLATGCGRSYHNDSSMADNQTPPPTVTRRTTEPNEEQQMRIEEADQAREAGDYARALSMFREILAENPTIATAYVGIGEVYMDQEDYGAAEPAFARAAQLEPRNFDAQFGHGRSLQMLGRLQEAVTAYHRALVIQPNSGDANLGLATTYLEMSEPGSARLFAEKAVDAEPDNGTARINLGAVYEQLGLHNEAVEQYRIAMELVEPTPEIIMNLVNALSRAKRYRETIEAAEQLNRMEPSANAYERIGHAWFRLKDYGKSMEAYREAVQVDPDHWPSWNGIGVNALNEWLLSKKRDSDSRRMAGDSLRRSLRINAEQPKIIQLISTYSL